MRQGGATTGDWRQGPAFLLFVLVVVNTVNWADRQVVPVLLPAIQVDLGLGDADAGLVAGVAFSLVYAVAAFVFGYLADRGSRRAVLLFGLVAWSLATAASGLATGLGTLFAARFFTGIGEASLYPCAMSLIADAFPAERRGRASGVLAASTALGGGLGIVLGGHLVESIGWRNVFFAYGMGGLVVLPLLLLLREPAMHRGEGRAAEDHVGASKAGRAVHEPAVLVVREALGDARLRAVWLSGTLLIACAMGWVAWAPTYATRELGYSLRDVSLVFGVAQLVGGIAGSTLGGWLGDRARRRRFAGQLRVVAMGSLMAAPMILLALWHLPYELFFLAAVAGPFALMTCFPNLQSVIAEIVPARRLGLTFAVHVFFLSGVGAAAGPYLIGLASDASGSLRTALVLPQAWAVLAGIAALVAERMVRSRTPGHAR